MTIETPFADPVIGPYMHTLLEQMKTSPAVILAVYIMLQKALKERSQWQRWIDVLPKEIQTPFQFNPTQMQALKGTALRYAAMHMYFDMMQEWRKMEPAVKTLCSALGIDRLPSAPDFMWAVAVVWSRAMEIPCSASEGVSFGLGLIPGIDFFNHSATPDCTWDLVEDASGRCYYQVVLMEDRSRDDAGTEELTINYGDRSNEEFFFLYGFVPGINPNDMLRIHMRDGTVHAEHRVFRHQLPSPSLVLPGGDVLRAAKEKIDVINVNKLTSLVPKEVWNRLAMLAEDTEVRDGSSILSSDEMNSSSVGDDNQEPQQLIDKLVQVLEEYEEILEGALGTGPLEKDIEILENFVYGKEPQWLWNVCVYRSTQKKLNREWLEVTKRMKARLQATDNNG